MRTNRSLVKCYLKRFIMQIHLARHRGIIVCNNVASQANTNSRQFSDTTDTRVKEFTHDDAVKRLRIFSFFARGLEGVTLDCELSVDEFAVQVSDEIKVKQRDIRRILEHISAQWETSRV